ncbi:hypothetical protein FWI19_08975, partial [Francisella tularensis subsp. holarctica]|nr:hypothetical protein [Francisella tularensis subsp. holarctica]
AILNIIVYLPACILGFLALKKLFVGNIVKKQLAFLFFFFFLSMIYLIIVQIILLDAASLFPQFLFNILIAIGFCNFIFVSYDNNENYFFNMSKIIFFVTFLQSIFVFLSRYYIFLNDWIFFFLVKKGNIEISNVIEYKLRVFGLSNAGGDGLGFSITIGLCFSIFYFIKYIKGKSIFTKLMLFVPLILIVFSNIFISRTSLLTSSLILLITIFYIYIKKEKLLFIIILALFFLSIWILFKLNLNLSWAFENIYSYIQSGDFSHGSLSVLINKMLFVPDNLLTWIFGCEDVSNTDIGYIKYLYYYGIIFSMFFYILIIFLYFEMRKCFISSEYRSLFLLLLIVCLVFQAKIIFLTVGLFTKLTIILFIFSLKENSFTTRSVI